MINYRTCVTTFLAMMTIMSATACQKEEVKATEATTETTTQQTTEASTTTEETTVTEEVTTTAVEEPEVTETTTTSLVPAAAPITDPAVKADVMGETYLESFSIHPEMKDKVLDVTVSLKSRSNVLVKASTEVQGKTISSVSLAKNDNGSKLYDTFLMLFPLKFLVTADGKDYIIDDSGKFYVNVTNIQAFDKSTLEATNLDYDYTIDGYVADYVSLHDKLFIRIPARDNSSGLDTVLYFDEDGVLTYVYTKNAVFGDAITTLSYEQVPDSYFEIPDAYDEYSYEQYIEYTNTILADLGYDQIVTTEAAPEEVSVEEEVTNEEESTEDVTG